MIFLVSLRYYLQMKGAKIFLIFLLAAITAIIIRIFLTLFGEVFIGCYFTDVSCNHDPIGGFAGLFLFYFIFIIKYLIFFTAAFFAKQFADSDFSRKILFVVFLSIPLFFDLIRYIFNF